MAARSRPAATKRLSNVRSPQFRSSLFPNVRRSVAFMPDAAEPLLSVRSLKKYFPIRRGILSRVADPVKAVDDIRFDINKGETFGLVGESGCGKTTADAPPPARDADHISGSIRVLESAHDDSGHRGGTICDTRHRQRFREK